MTNVAQFRVRVGAAFYYADPEYVGLAQPWTTAKDSAIQLPLEQALQLIRDTVNSGQSYASSSMTLEPV